MSKRKREESLSEDCMMEVQDSKNQCYDFSAAIQYGNNQCSNIEETIPPQLIGLLKEILRDGPAEQVERNLNPLGASRLDSCVASYEIDKFKTEADVRLKQTVRAKICTISEQMRFLRQQLFSTLEDAHGSLKLNHLQCSVRKVPGNVYYLYDRDGQSYFSILSPSDWNGHPPHPYCGSFLYDYDFSWKKL